MATAFAARTADLAQGAGAIGDRRIKEAAFDGALNDVVYTEKLKLLEDVEKKQGMAPGTLSREFLGAAAKQQRAVTVAAQNRRVNEVAMERAIGKVIETQNSQLLRAVAARYGLDERRLLWEFAPLPPPASLPLPTADGVRISDADFRSGAYRTLPWAARPFDPRYGHDPAFGPGGYGGYGVWGGAYDGYPLGPDGLPLYGDGFAPYYYPPGTGAAAAAAAAAAGPHPYDAYLYGRASDPAFWGDAADGLGLPPSVPPPPGPARFGRLWGRHRYYDF